MDVHDKVEIVLLAERDVPGVVRCIQHAFADDPYFNWAFDKTKFSTARNFESLRARCLWGAGNAIFIVAKETHAPDGVGSNNSDGAGDARGTGDDDDNVLGVAMWLPPHKADTPQTWTEWWAGWVLWGRQIVYNLRYGRGGLNVKRYYIWKSAQRAAQEELWTDPEGYYFCNIVTVLPGQQGRGIGKLLFEHVTDMADAEGRKCYLESSRDIPNTAIYERLGFRKVKEMACDDESVVCKVCAKSLPLRTL